MSQLIYDELERAILTGQLKPRERLTEMALAGRFGTSRTSVREALKQLELRELVVATRHRGATVRDFTSTELAEIYAVRAVLEEMAARLAIEHASPRDIAETERWARRFEVACRREDLAAMVTTNRGFHRRIVRSGGNRLLVEMVDDLCRRTFLVRNIVWQSRGNVEQSIRAHTEMIAALRQRDEHGMVKLTLEHIAMGREVYLAMVGRS
ncbi:MAG: GntR family transcriptional regulator [Candidatus Rokubacteria bacterium]|nr:GntR family transcriptional regulator [Candidatus Rokubacteria bacterium]